MTVTAQPAEALTGEVYLRPDEVYRVLPGMTAGSLAQLRHRGVGPAYVQHRRRGRVLYRVADLRAWSQQQRADEPA